MCRNRRVIASLLIVGCVLSAIQLPLSASGRSLAHRASVSHFQTGIGDEQVEMFSNPLWRQLHTRIVRYIAPYDAAVRPYSLQQARDWITAAEAQHQQVLVSFYHSEYTPTRLPSVSLYQSDVRKFVKLFPHVRQYQPWDEVNRGSVRGLFSSPSASAAARYYQALKRSCPGCTIVGLDLLDQQNPRSTLSYITQFKREIYRIHTVMPRVWGLHNYSDVNRLERWRTREIVAALRGQVWLTETGGIVKFGRQFPNHKGSGLSRAARVLRFTFQLAAAESKVTRLYLYNWSGGGEAARFDAGLMDPRYRPRAGYVAVCRQLHASRCGVKISRR